MLGKEDPTNLLAVVREIRTVIAIKVEPDLI